MRVTILTVGSRGDVEPCVALGMGLKRVGYEVRVATHSTFREFVEEKELRFSPLSVDPRAVVESLGRSGASGASMMRNFRRALEPALYQAAGEALDACEDADGLVVSSAAFFGYDVASALGIPVVTAALQPLFGRTRHFPNALMPSKVGLRDGSFPARVFGGLYNSLSHRVAEQLLWQPFRRTLNGIRRELLSLPPQPFLGPLATRQIENRTQLYGWSRHLLEKPPDWGENRHVTGYWFLGCEKEWEPPQGLLDFLQDGPPPVCMGFGSSTIADPEGNARVFAETARRLGQRGILLGGWGGLGSEDLPENIFQIEWAPYYWLLPKTRGFIHHGSSGAAHAALRAGIPSVTVPVYGDQLLWGYLLARSGAAPPPIPRRSLDAPRLASAVSGLFIDERIRAGAARLGEMVASEDGVGEAVEIMDGTFAGRKSLERT